MKVLMLFQEENRKEIKEDTSHQVKVSHKIIKEISRVKRAREISIGRSLKAIAPIVGYKGTRQ
jgi:hypothetical protein